MRPAAEPSPTRQSWSDRLATEHDRDLFYIGATRATHRLVVLAHEGLRSRLRRVSS
jgi:hypothetical protein